MTYLVTTIWHITAAFYNHCETFHLIYLIYIDDTLYVNNIRRIRNLYYNLVYLNMMFRKNTLLSVNDENFQ